MYITSMTNIDKFCSDADRLMTRSGGPDGLTPGRLAAELSRMFLICARDYGDLASNLAAYWIDEYTSSLSTTEGRKAAVDWFSFLLALLEGTFTKDMDFSDRDWEEIRDNVSADAENLDMDLVMSIMTIIVDRGKS
jgi:hypothetical protein